MALGLTFRPKLVPTAAAVVGVILTAYLGDWQLRRAAFKAERQQHLERAASGAIKRIPGAVASREELAYAHVEVEGRFLPERTIFLDNRVRHGQPGYEVVTPLQIEDTSTHVLVKRGWVQAPRLRTEWPAVRTPEGIVRVEGIALPPARAFELSRAASAGRVWQNLHLEDFARQTGLRLQPVLVEQRNDLGDGLARDWPRPDTGIDVHRAYALQWFSMCAAIAALYVILNVKRSKQTLGPA